MIFLCNKTFRCSVLFSIGVSYFLRDSMILYSNNRVDVKTKTSVFIKKKKTNSKNVKGNPKKRTYFTYNEDIGGRDTITIVRDWRSLFIMSNENIYVPITNVNEKSGKTKENLIDNLYETVFFHQYCRITTDYTIENVYTCIVFFLRIDLFEKSSE